MLDVRVVMILGVLAGTACDASPTPPEPPPPPIQMRSVSAGYYGTCGIGIDDRAYCWGSSRYGQLGFPAPEECSSIPGEDPCAHQPGAVADTLKFTVLQSGGIHACGLTALGAAYCWGDDTYGQIGNHDTAGTCLYGSPCAPTPAPAYLPGPLIALSSGDSHSCAVHHTGIIYCWGNGSYGQLGNGYGYRNEVPVIVQSGTLRFRSVAAGGSFTCGLAQDSTAHCWGRNHRGQLGDSTQYWRSYPLPVLDGRKFTQLVAGSSHVCGMTQQGPTYCWGDGEALGTAIALADCSGAPCSFVPVAVSGGHTFARIAAGSGYTCGITVTGSYCWGAAPGLATVAAAPVAFGTAGAAGGAPFVAITAGFDHACGIAAPDAAYCWGTDYHGSLGGGPGIIVSSVPVRVLGPSAPPLP